MSQDPKSKIRIYFSPNSSVAKQMVKAICEYYEKECDFNRGLNIMWQARSFFDAWIDRITPTAKLVDDATWSDVNEYIVSNGLLGEDEYLILLTEDSPEHYQALVVNKSTLSLLEDFIPLADPVE